MKLDLHRNFHSKMSPVFVITCLLVVLQTAVTQYNPPSITDPVRPRTFYYQSRSDVQISCKAEGYPSKIRYKWLRDMKEIPSDGIITVDRDSGLLRIKEFTYREEGMYQCVAENRITPGVSPASVSPPITLLQIKLDDFPGENHEVPGAEGDEGDYAALDCTNPPTSVPKAVFSWYETSVDQPKPVQMPNTERVYVDNKGTLHFMYLEPKDAQFKYKCAVSNGEKNRIVLSKILNTLRVKGVQVKAQIKPSSVYHTNPAQFLRTQTAELECVFSGYPLPTITWKDKYGKKISKNDKYEMEPNSYNRKLKIKNLNESDEGVYTCMGENSVGRLEVSVFLDVTSGPIWTKGLTDQVVPDDKSAKFTCKARQARGETALSDPVWYKNGRLINTISSGNIHLSEKSTVLTVTPLKKPRDIMCFQCNVSNDVGFEFDSACLNVIEPIVIEEQPPEIQEIEKGAVVKLTVRGKTDPAMKLRYRWYIRNVTYDHGLPSFVTYNDRTKEAYINTSLLSDAELEDIEGVYICELHHDHDRRTVRTEVIIKGLPKPIPVVAASFPWWIIVIVALLLIAIIIVVIIICCCRRKDNGDYKVYAKELKTTYLNPDKDIEDHKFHDVALIEDESSAKKPLRLDVSFDDDDDENVKIVNDRGQSQA